MVILLVGVVGYFLITGSRSNTTQQSQSENNNTTDTGTMMNKVGMGLFKAEVNQAIGEPGEPYECAQGDPAMAEDAQYKMEQCSYGDKNAANHLGVIYMDGKVWGMSSVNNTTR